jgi:hypothetical protein
MKGLLPHIRNSLLAGVMITALLLIGCVSFGVDSYEEFRGAVKSGASCRELFDIKSNFNGSIDRRIERDLDEIGCDSPRSTRTDL